MDKSPAFSWTAEWIDQPDPALTMAHSSLAITSAGSIVSGATDMVGLEYRDREGAVTRRIPLPFADDVHGITLVAEAGSEALWIADTAMKLHGGSAELDIDTPKGDGQLLQVSLDGELIRRLDRPGHSAYVEEGAQFRPTAVAVNEKRLGGDGSIYVSDGYGAGLVHHYDDSGDCVGTLSGEEGAGRFNQPHDVLIDRRGDSPRLYVADRVNRRIQVYRLDGQFERSFGEDDLLGPTQMALAGDLLVVTDLLAGRLSVFDSDDRFLGHWFASPSPPTSWDALPDGWPNARTADGLIGPAQLHTGRFHTPHGIAVDGDQTVYVSEFAIGGRIAVLRLAP